MIVDIGVRFEWQGHRGLFTWIKVNTNHAEAAEWCQENLGDPSRDTWWYSKRKFYFTKRDDITLFMLRWS